MDGGQTQAPAFRTSAKPPPGLSASALDKRLGLRKRAREDAARNIPRQDATDLSAAELAVVEIVAGERARVDQARNLAKAEAERRLRALAPEPQDFAGPAARRAAGAEARRWTLIARLG